MRVPDPTPVVSLSAYRRRTIVETPRRVDPAVWVALVGLVILLAWAVGL